MEVFINAQKSKEDQKLDDQFCKAVENAIDHQKVLGNPVAGYDGQMAYLEYPDGSIIYID